MILLKKLQVYLFHTKKRFLTVYNHNITPSNFNYLKECITFNDYTIKNILLIWSIPDICKLLFNTNNDTKSMRRIIFNLKRVPDIKVTVNIFYFLLIFKHKPDYLKIKIAQYLLDSENPANFAASLALFPIQFKYNDILSGRKFIDLFSNKYIDTHLGLFLSSNLQNQLSSLDISSPIKKINNFNDKITLSKLNKKTIYVPNNSNNIDELITIIKKQISYKNDRQSIFHYKIYKLLEGLTYRQYTIKYPKTSKELIHWSLILENCLWSHVSTIKNNQLFIFGLFDENDKLFAAFSVQDDEFKDINGLRNSLNLSPEFVYSFKVFIDDSIEECIKNKQHTLYDNRPWKYWLALSPSKKDLDN